jgi:hypothetical protein
LKDKEPLITDFIMSSPIPFRLTIGVTGHRTLPDEQPLREAVQRVLNEIKAAHRYDDLTEFSWCILTPLAEGADRLVAEEVLNRHEGSKLKAVLPLTVSDYMEDFSTERSKEEFQGLMAKDRSPTSLRKLSLKDEYPPEMAADARKQAYEDVGRFVVDYCDILIALWDGKESRGKGSTAEMLQYAAERKCPHYIISTNAPQEYTFINGGGNVELSYRNIGKFNSHAETMPSLGQKVQCQYDDLFSKKEIPEGQQLPREIREAIKINLLPYYVAADTLALKYQGAYFHTGSMVFMLALAAVSVVAAGVIFLGRPSWHFFAVELVILAVIGGSIYFADKIKRVHKNWRAYRFLAERLRCAIFLAVCGVEPPPLFVNRRTEEQDGHSEDDQWILMAFEEIWNRMPRQKVSEGDGLELRKNYILKAWIEDQIRYHTENYEKKSQKSKKWERIGEIVFYCAIGAAAFHLLWPVVIGILIALILPAVGTMAESLRSHRQFKYLAMHSQKMAKELRALKNAYRLLTPQKFEDLLIETDRLMMRENEDWLALTGSTHLSKAI